MQTQVGWGSNFRSQRLAGSMACRVAGSSFLWEQGAFGTEWTSQAFEFEQLFSP
jgi:hypothetical protein